MRSPSPRCLANRVDLYRFAPAFDADAGVDGTLPPYPVAFATTVPCSVQLTDSGVEEYGADGSRIGRLDHYTVLFAADYALKVKDMIAWTDGGVTHHLIVAGSLNAAGRSSNWSVTATERL